MDLCRTCLKTPAKKLIPELEKEFKDVKINYIEIMLFCLDIKVKEDSKITSNLCNTCYRKIVTFYKFKALSLKNDAYLKSLNPVVTLENKKPSVYIDTIGIKHENLLENDDYGNCILEENVTEINVKNEDKLENKYVENEEPPEDIQIDRKDEGIWVDVVERPTPSTVNEEKKTMAKGRQKAVRKKRVHQLKPPKPESQICEECGKHVRNLQKHLACHQPTGDRKMLPCKVPECPKQFFSKHGQRYHYKSVHLNVKFKCDICNKEVRNLTVHHMRSHNQSALPHGCPLCDRRCASKSVLAVHMITHTQDHAFECEHCNKRFRSMLLLTLHIRQVHDKERKFQCEYCSKGFFKKIALQNHIRKHTKERPYKCDECGKCFTVKGSLNSHLLLHSGEKNFQCEHCPKSFVKPEFLKTKIRKTCRKLKPETYKYEYDLFIDFVLKHRKRFCNSVKNFFEQDKPISYGEKDGVTREERCAHEEHHHALELTI